MHSNSIRHLVISRDIYSVNVASVQSFHPSPIDYFAIELFTVYLTRGNSARSCKGVIFISLLPSLLGLPSTRAIDVKKDCRRKELFNVEAMKGRAHN